MILAVGFELAQASLIDVLTVALAIIAFRVILWRPLAAPAVVACGAVVGLLTGVFH